MEIVIKREIRPVLQLLRAHAWVVQGELGVDYKELKEGYSFKLPSGKELLFEQSSDGFLVRINVSDPRDQELIDLLTAQPGVHVITSVPINSGFAFKLHATERKVGTPQVDAIDILIRSRL